MFIAIISALDLDRLDNNIEMNVKTEKEITAVFIRRTMTSPK